MLCLELKNIFIQIHLQVMPLLFVKEWNIIFLALDYL
jgi:hypothetical protein